jgi:Sec-independent protein translocase protein TatA
MDFLNVGPAELVFVVLLAILVIGPKKTVEYGQQLGRLLVHLRRQWQDVQRDLMTEVRAIERDVVSAASVPEILDEPSPDKEEQDE